MAKSKEGGTVDWEALGVCDGPAESVEYESNTLVGKTVVTIVDIGSEISFFRKIKKIIFLLKLSFGFQLFHFFERDFFRLAAEAEGTLF